MISTIYYEILTYFSLGLGIFLAIVIYLSNPRSPLNRFFVLLNFSSLIWATTPFFIKFLGDSDWVHFYFRVTYLMGAVSGYSGYRLIISLFPKIKRSRLLDIASAVLFVLGSLIALSPFLVIGHENTVWGANPILGAAKFIFHPIIIFYAVVVLYLIIKGYIVSDSAGKSQSIYFIIGFGSLILLAAPSIVISGLIGLPSIRYWHIGALGSPLLVFFTALAIFRKRAFDVKAIVTDFLVGMFGIALLILPIFSTGLVRILSSFLFVFFIAIGYSLIKYTHGEAKRKEVLEVIVEERTKELAEKVKELDKWYHLTVGRELRMAELKKTIKELEGGCKPR